MSRNYGRSFTDIQIGTFGKKKKPSKHLGRLKILHKYSQEQLKTISSLDIQKEYQLIESKASELPAAIRNAVTILYKKRHCN